MRQHSIFIHFVLLTVCIFIILDILDAILNFSKCSMMTGCHHPESLIAMSYLQESTKKKTLHPTSRSIENMPYSCRTIWAVKALVWTTKPTGSPTPESRKSTQPKRVPVACLFYTEMCIFCLICPPISRKPEFCRHSSACGLRVPPLYCKTH